VDSVPEITDDVDYEDIIRFKPKPIMVISDDTANQLLWDLGPSTVSRVLRQGPMTLREIQAAYNSLAEEQDNLEPKSDTTIYRYVKALESAGLVAQAGRRVQEGKVASEILYSRTAKVFQPKAFPPSYWNSDAGKTFFERAYASLSHILEGYEVDKEGLRAFVRKFEQEREDETNDTISKLDDDALEFITGGDWWEIEQTLRFTGLFALFLKRPEIIEELRSLYKKK
jgi:hypothetical protein